MLEYHMGLPMSTPIFFFFVIFRKIYTIYSRHSIKGRGSSLSNTFPDFFHNKLLSKVQSPALFSGFWTFSIINHSLRSNPLLSSLDFGPSQQKSLLKVQSPALFSGFWTFSIINHSLRSKPLLSSPAFGPFPYKPLSKNPFSGSLCFFLKLFLYDALFKNPKINVASCLLGSFQSESFSKDPFSNSSSSILDLLHKKAFKASNINTRSRIYTFSIKNGGIRSASCLDGF